MKKIVRLTENDLVRIVKRIMNEQQYGSFGDTRRKDSRGDRYVRSDDRYPSDEELYGIGDDDLFDVEEFDDYESYRERYPEDDNTNPDWFKGRQGKTMFDIYRKTTGKPFKVKTRRK